MHGLSNAERTDAPARVTRLTKRIVESLEPRSRRYIVWDAEVKGFGVRVETRGTRTYIVRYRPRGMGARGPKRFVTIGRHGVVTAEQARAQAQMILGTVAAGGDPAATLATTRTSITVGELIDRFLHEHIVARRKTATAAGYRIILETYVRPRLGRRLAQSLTRVELAELHLTLKDRPYQANRLLAVIGSMYAFAANRNLVPEGVNPARGLERYREHRRERYLSTTELDRLGATLRVAETTGIPWAVDETKPKAKHLPKSEHRLTMFPAHVTAAIRLLLFTGARLREILHLRWKDVDVERRLAFLPDSKTGRKTLVLNTSALSVLETLAPTGPFVIAGGSPDKPRVDLNGPWRAIRRHARLEGVRLHDLRHTFASVGAGASLGLPIVGKLLGHSQPATTARYAHVDASPLQLAAEAIGVKLAKAMGGE